MATDSSDSDTPATESRSQRIHRIVQQCLAQSTEGQAFSTESLVRAHSDLMPELEEALHKLQLVLLGQQQSSRDTNGVERPADPTFQNGRVGHYELLDCLGAGSFGVVWKAHDTRLSRFVAIKVPHEDPTQGDLGRLFTREARAAAQLRWPNWFRY